MSEMRELEIRVEASRDAARERLYKQVQLSIKAVLCEAEALARMDPKDACNPVTFDGYRKRIVRRLWELYKHAVDYGSID